MRRKVTTTLLTAVALLLAAPAFADGGTCIGAQEIIKHPAMTETIEHPAQEHEEYIYEQTVENTTYEYRFRTRTPLYGTKEIKSVQGWDFVDGGTSHVNGTSVAGHWVESPGLHQIPDVIINIVWGPDGVPEQYLGTGTVNLSSYGGPNRNVQYTAEKVATDEGYTDWGPWSAPSTEPYAEDDLTDVETIPTTTSHTERTDWQTATEDAPWVLVDTRTVTDAEAWTETVTVTEAWTEVIEHEIVCTPNVPETITTPDVPETTTTSEPDVPTLAETGTPENTALLAGIATLLIGSGIVVFMLVRSK